MTDSVQGMRERPEAEREEVAAEDLRWIQRGQLPPARDAFRQPDDWSDGDQLASGHGRFVRGGSVKVVALHHIFEPFFHHPRHVFLTHAAEFVEIGTIVDGAVGGSTRTAKDGKVLRAELARPQLGHGLEDVADWLVLRIGTLPVRVVGGGRVRGRARSHARPGRRLVDFRFGARVASCRHRQLTSQRPTITPSINTAI